MCSKHALSVCAEKNAKSDVSESTSATGVFGPFVASDRDEFCDHDFVFDYDNDENDTTTTTTRHLLARTTLLVKRPLSHLCTGGRLDALHPQL